MNPPRPAFAAICIVGVTLIALLCNGATGAGARWLVVALIGAAVLLAPIEHRHERKFTALALLLFALALGAFLPASWFPQPAWRAAAAESGFSLPRTVSPQPWLSFEALVALAAGLVWLYYLTAKSWTRHERAWVCRAVALSSILLAGAYVALRFAGKTWPFAEHAEQFGPFPNKNQTASVLVLGAALTMGLIGLPSRRRQRRRRIARLPWVAGLAVLVAGLLAVESRAGLLLLFGVAAALGLTLGARSGAPRTLALGTSLVLLAITGLFVGGGGLLDKFNGERGVIATAAANGRWDIYRDSLALIRDNPLTGVGAGNFEDTFALHRNASAAPDRALHPDSDVLWAAAEIGIPATAVAIALLLYALSTALPLRFAEGADSRRDHTLRAACLVAVLAFCAHSIIDVPSHRMGAVLPAMLLLGLAAHPRRERRPATFAARRIFAAAAALPALAAVALLAGRIPSTEQASAQIAAAADALADGRPDAAAEACDAALLSRPLAAEAFLLRAQAHLQLGDFDPARDDFERVRFLHPHHAEVVIDEGRLWMPHSPQHAISAWGEAVARARHVDPREHRAAELYHQVLNATQGAAAIEEDVWLLAAEWPDLQIAAMKGGDTERNRRNLARTFDANPGLDGWAPAQITAALDHLAKLRGPRELIATVERRPQWGPLCWRSLSEAYAQTGDFQRAFAIVDQACGAPELERIRSPLSRDELTTAYLRSPGNFTLALRLAQQLLDSGMHSQALDVISPFDTGASDVPPIIRYLKAQCLAGEAQFQQAHQMLLGYAATTR